MVYYKAQLLSQVRKHIINGGIIAYPTESCYGFGCDPFNYQAIEKIIRLKGRSRAKGMIVIAGNLRQLEKLILPLSDEDKQEVAKIWPGAYTLILPATAKVPSNLMGRHKKIAVRLTGHKLVHQLCAYLNMPLVSTSANHSLAYPVTSYRECLRQFGDKVLVLPGLTGFARRPSTIIDWDSKKILR